MFTPLEESVVPLAPLGAMPNGVPERRPLPVGSGGGASLVEMDRERDPEQVSECMCGDDDDDDDGEELGINAAHFIEGAGCEDLVD